MDRCPHIKRTHCGDESWDYCLLSEKPSGRIRQCELITGECKIWEEIKKEEKDE